MANIAFLRNNVVAFIAQRSADLPANAAYDASQDATGANVGDTWNGSAYIPPALPVTVANEQTIRQQAANALASNLQDIADADAWLNGVGAGTGTLTAAQLTPAVRQIMRALRASKKTENGALRLLLGQFDSTS
jgi:hypothetical protein